MCSRQVCVKQEPEQEQVDGRLEMDEGFERAFVHGLYRLQADASVAYGEKPQTKAVALHSSWLDDTELGHVVAGRSALVGRNVRNWARSNRTEAFLDNLTERRVTVHGKTYDLPGRWSLIASL